MKKPTYHVLIDLSRPATHRARVRISRGTEPLPATLQFPVWTPGSYLVREYSRHVTLLQPAHKVNKNTWRLEGNPAHVEYEVYCYERTVRTSFLDDHYAALVGASLLPLLGADFEVELRTPASWRLVSSALGFKRRGPGRWVARARDDDHWIDCPIVAAAPGCGGVGKFTYQGITHHIAWVGLGCARSMKEMEEAFRKIAHATIGLFGGAPFREYWFLLHFGQKLYGGLEHRDSQLSQFDGNSLSESKDWDGFLRLVAHEYLHSWNVKSIRPKALGPFNYSAENYTPDIWFAEGITDYLDDLLCLKAGLLKPDAYARARLKDATSSPDGAPGQSRRSLAESSFDAWIRYYRPDEDSLNTDVSYYAKGSLLGWCWDAHLHRKSRGRWNLPKLMKAIWREFGIDAYESLAAAKPGFTREELLAFAERKTKIPQRALVEGWVTARKPLPWREAAREFRIPFEERMQDPFFAQAGFQLQWKGSQAVVSKVAADSAAEAAGLSANDEILAIGDRRLADPDRAAQTWRKAVATRRPVELLVCRLDKVIYLKLKVRPHRGLGVEYVHAPRAD